MRKIPVDQIEDKMVLAREIRGRSGNVLLNKGATLNPFMGRRLKNWEIYFVYVEGEEEQQEESAAPTVSAEEINKHLEQKFSAVLHNSIMKKIFAAVCQHKVHQTSQ
ncbi:MAG: hypothetical protein GF398_09515 [Chitinivibrionales bacterium]|nr:hypothetical protein [Chitinivibrionales bacterium]